MKNNKVNDNIRAYRVILINHEGTNKGEMLKVAALDIARQIGMDLVEVSDGAVPVCKIMDYGKMLYQRQKSESHHQHAPSIKEIHFGYKTEQHDLDIKKRKVSEFLEKGHKVIVFMEVKGRERYVSGGLAKEKFKSWVKEFSPTASVSDISESEKGYNATLSPSK